MASSRLMSHLSTTCDECTRSATLQLGRARPPGCTSSPPILQTLFLLHTQWKHMCHALSQGQPVACHDVPGTLLHATQLNMAPTAITNKTCTLHAPQNILTPIAGVQYKLQLLCAALHAWTCQLTWKPAMSLISMAHPTC